MHSSILSSSKSEQPNLPRTTSAHHVSVLPSPTISIYPAVCRICHSSEGSIPYNGTAPGEPLISPCSCKGTMGLYHRSCLERWLTMSKTTCCEICKFAFQIKYAYPSFYSFLRHAECEQERRNFIADCLCFIILTPLAIGCILLCWTGTHQQTKGFTRWSIDALGLITLGVMLTFTYFVWFSITVGFHIKVYLEWRKGHKKLSVVDQLSEHESFLVNGHRNSNNNNKGHARWPFLVSSLNCAYCANTTIVSSNHSVPTDNQQNNAQDNTNIIDAIIATPENSAVRSRDDDGGGVRSPENISAHVEHPRWDDVLSGGQGGDGYEEIDMVVVPRTEVAARVLAQSAANISQGMGPSKLNAELALKELKEVIAARRNAAESNLSKLTGNADAPSVEMENFIERSFSGSPRTWTTLVRHASSRTSGNSAGRAPATRSYSSNPGTTLLPTTTSPLLSSTTCSSSRTACKSTVIVSRSTAISSSNQGSRSTSETISDSSLSPSTSLGKEAEAGTVTRLTGLATTTSNTNAESCSNSAATSPTNSSSASCIPLSHGGIEWDNDEDQVMGLGLVSMSSTSARFMASTPLQSATSAKVPLFNFNATPVVSPDAEENCDVEKIHDENLGSNGEKGNLDRNGVQRDFQGASGEKNNIAVNSSNNNSDIKEKMKSSSSSNRDRNTNDNKGNFRSEFTNNAIFSTFKGN